MQYTIKELIKQADEYIEDFKKRYFEKVDYFDLGEFWEHRYDWIREGRPEGDEYKALQDKWYSMDEEEG